MTKAEMHSGLASKEKKLTLFLLCWLFGLFSLHRFYTGKYLSGGLQLLTLLLAGLLGAFEIKVPGIITGAIGGVWLIVDFILIIMGKFTDKEGKLITDWI
jgi:TM2 domain-containing membrane protein YozV